MLYEIKRYNSPNFESRGSYKPILIVNHITDGVESIRRDDEHEETAVFNTFMNPNSKASSTLTITRDGRIKQFVDIVNAPWTQGLGGSGAEKSSTSPIVRDMGWKTNLYCLSIEYDAWGPNNGGDGNITEEQFWAGAWAHKWLQMSVEQKYGHKIPLNSTYAIGHCHVDPVRKPMCPGVNFPWTRMYRELAVADSMSFENYEGRLRYLRSDKYKLKQCVDVWNEVEYLKDCADGVYGEGDRQWALSIFRTLYAAFLRLNIFDDDVYTAKDDYKRFHGHVVYIYNCAMGKEGPGNIPWGIDMMAKAHPFMLQNGLVEAV